MSKDIRTVLILVVLDEEERHQCGSYPMGVYSNAPIKSTWYLWWMPRIVKGRNGGLGSAQRNVGWDRASSKAPPDRIQGISTAV